jgi:hypothetical protein
VDDGPAPLLPPELEPLLPPLLEPELELPLLLPLPPPELEPLLPPLPPEPELEPELELPPPELEPLPPPLLLSPGKPLPLEPLQPAAMATAAAPPRIPQTTVLMNDPRCLRRSRPLERIAPGGMSSAIALDPEKGAPAEVWRKP